MFKGMTPEQFEQAVSFVYGNLAIENPHITKESVREAGLKLLEEANAGTTVRVSAGQVKEATKEDLQRLLDLMQKPIDTSDIPEKK